MSGLKEHSFVITWDTGTQYWNACFASSGSTPISWVRLDHCHICSIPGLNSSLSFLHHHLPRPTSSVICIYILSSWVNILGPSHLMPSSRTNAWQQGWFHLLLARHAVCIYLTWVGSDGTRTEASAILGFCYPYLLSRDQFSLTTCCSPPHPCILPHVWKPGGPNLKNLHGEAHLCLLRPLPPPNLLVHLRYKKVQPTVVWACYCVLCVWVCMRVCVCLCASCGSPISADLFSLYKFCLVSSYSVFSLIGTVLLLCGATPVFSGYELWSSQPSSGKILPLFSVSTRP